MKKPESEKAGGKLDLGFALEDLAGKMKNADLNNWFIFGSIGLVLVIGLLALFHPAERNARLGNPACGKIVVAADGPSMRSNVAASVDSAQYFLVINPLSSKLLEAVKNPFFTTQLPTSNVAYFVAGKGEEAVIAGDIDPLCYQILSQFGVRAYGGYTGRVKDVVDLYRQAAITPGMRPRVAQYSMQTPAAAAPVALGQPYSMGANGLQQEAGAAPVGGQGAQAAPPIFSNALMPHAYRGVCSNCHQISPASSDTGIMTNNVQNTQGAPPIFSNATMPHAYRGVCSNCHQIASASTDAGAAQRVAWPGRLCPVR